MNRMTINSTRNIYQYRYLVVASFLLALVAIVASYLIIRGSSEASLTEILLLTTGSVAGAGFSAAISILISSGTDQQILDKIDNAFNVIDDGRSTTHPISNLFRKTLYIYYTSSHKPDETVWKVAKLVIDGNVGRSILKGKYTTMTQNSGEITYESEIIGLHGKVIILTKSSETPEPTIVSIALDSIDGSQAFGVEQSRTWVRSEKVGPLILSKELLFKTKYPSLAIDDDSAKKLEALWSYSGIKQQFGLSKESGANDQEASSAS